MNLRLVGKTPTNQTEKVNPSPLSYADVDYTRARRAELKMIACRYDLISWRNSLRVLGETKWNLQTLSVVM